MINLKESWEKLVQNLVRNNILKTPKVINAFKVVPREIFLPGSNNASASIDTPLPIGEGQTVSAPHD